jgi:uncharacterized protein
MQLTLSILPEELSVCRLAPDASLPDLERMTGFWSLTRTSDELSLVVLSSMAPQQAQISPGWRGLKVEGPLDFSLIGILAGLSAALAQAGISIFALSTYDTDYLLVRGADLDKAVAALRAGGCTIKAG